MICLKPAPPTRRRRSTHFRSRRSIAAHRKRLVRARVVRGCRNQRCGRAGFNPSGAPGGTAGDDRNRGRAASQFGGVTAERRLPAHSESGHSGARRSRNRIRRRQRVSLPLLQEGVVVGRARSALFLSRRLGPGLPRPGQVRPLARRVPSRAHRLRGHERGVRRREEGNILERRLCRGVSAPDRDLRRAVQEIWILVC